MSQRGVHSCSSPLENWKTKGKDIALFYCNKLTKCDRDRPSLLWSVSETERLSDLVLIFPFPTDQNNNK